MPAKETALAARVVAWLEVQHWDVYQEVATLYSGGVADIVAVRDGRLWAIETKASLTLGVLMQAASRSAHWRSAAFPRPKHHTSEHHCLRKLALQYFKVGLIEIIGDAEYGGIAECEPAPLMRHMHQRAQEEAARLRPQQKTFAPAGTNRGGHWTPYKDTIETVRRFLSARPGGATLGEILADVGKAHYSSAGSARGCLRRALEEWEADWCVVSGEGKARRYYVKGVAPQG